jgi:hypothetical protein
MCGDPNQPYIKEQFMGNETEKDVQHQQPKPTDQSRKSPSHEGGQSPNQQDPYKKNPSHGDDPRQRDGDEASEQAEKRRAS